MKSFIKISLISAVFQIGYAKQVQTGHTAPVKSSYIVTLKPSTEGNALDEHLDKVRKLFGSNKHTSEKNKINHVYGEVLLGYSADFTSDVLAEVKAMPEVDVVEKNQVVKGGAIQDEAPWGLARLTSNDRLLHISQLWTYKYDPSAGEGVDVYVVDSGIKIDHPEFEGRAKWGANFVDDVDTDVKGHGTHVAGIIGSKTYGVAKKSTLIAVKVLEAQGDGDAQTSIAGVNWAVKNKKEGRGCVINLSLGIDLFEAFNTAVRNAIKSGCGDYVCGE
ncbi:proteinase B [Entomophthora muscae]|uniref:Proteinase B n=1 Tax=Entomophthora muscae TaxID=34485 RepID=A0ACC2SNX4_9FUNG|nr:proteinase B [Entomophthora muscae]